MRSSELSEGALASYARRPPSRAANATPAGKSWQGRIFAALESSADDLRRRRACMSAI